MVAQAEGGSFCCLQLQTACPQMAESLKDIHDANQGLMIIINTQSEAFMRQKIGSLQFQLLMYSGHKPTHLHN